MLMPVVLVRQGRLSDETPPQAACRSLLCVYTHIDMHCPALLHAIICDSSSKIQPEVDHRVHLLPEASENFHAFSPGFSQKVAVSP